MSRELGVVDPKGHYVLLEHEHKVRRNLTGNVIVDALDNILIKAIQVHASDIHLQPEEHGMEVRFRIDGVLHHQELLSQEYAIPLVSRIKIISGLDIAQRRLPQDGNMTIQTSLAAAPIDVRVATLPSTHGEKVVIRILNRSQHALDMSSLGLPDYLLATLQRMSGLSHGLFLVTGPTGSGKTTSLYAMLGLMDHEEKNIITMEDPVEYRLPGITQCQINPKLGFSFDTGLRSMLRQDPDVMMVGEIRDTATAQMAIEAALTGHLILSTLHTNSALGAIARLLDMGIEPFLINASLEAVLAQRLLRKLCNGCKRPDQVHDAEASFLERFSLSLDKIYRPVGCKQCFYVGYQGRTGVFELLIINDALRQLIIQKASVQALHNVAVSSGFQSMMQHAIMLVQTGIISLEECATLMVM